MPACPQCQAAYEASQRFCASCGFPVGEVSQRTDDPLIGKTFPGGYVLIDLIGVGGMGRVYRAEQKALGRTVAVKVIHPHLHGEEGAAARFITEARAASRLNHPNVVSVIDFGRTGASDGNLLYLVMEFLRGRDLSRVAYEEGPLSFPRIVDILKQTLGALDEAHHLGIIHRDVKPENIVLEPMRGGGDFVKVVDFGLAKLRPDMLTGITTGNTGITSPGIVCGTPDYMSPEQGRGDPLDARSDLYALGVIMFQLMTGQLPFEAASPTQVVLMHLQQPPPDPRKIAPDRKIPDALAEVCLTALTKDRERRYRDAPVFVQALDAAMSRIGKAPTIALNKPVTCPACNSEVPAGQKFCGECGARISVPAVAASDAPALFAMEPTRPGVSVPPISGEVAAKPRERVSSQSRAAMHLPLPLLGRDEDMSWLQDRRAEAATATRGARLVGEVGVGKTRLLEEFLQRAQSDGDVVVSATPDPSWAEVGYFGLADVIGKLAQVDRTTDLAKLPIDATQREIVERGLTDVVIRPMSTKSSPDARRFAVAAALRWAIVDASRRANGRRIVIAFDDLPRFDGATRHAISDVLGEPPACPLLVLATHPSGFDAGWPAGRALARVLGGLSASIALTALRGVASTTATSVSDRINGSARGVAPLYLDQLVRFGREGGGPAPHRLADLIALRVERVGADARRVLQAAGVLGDDQRPEILARLLPKGTDVATSLRACSEAGLLLEAGGLYRFAHPLFRDVSIATIPAGVRRELHAAAGELGEEAGAPLELRALHAFYAAEAFEALMLLEQVADRCAQRGDEDGAILALRRSLELARRALFRGDLDEPERAVVIFSRKLGDALSRAGYLTDAEGILREALDLAGPADPDRARVLESLARVARVRERMSEASALLREAIATASRSGARELLATLEQLQADWRVAS
jgi:serine/threonine protein kinase